MLMKRFFCAVSVFALLGLAAVPSVSAKDSNTSPGNNAVSHLSLSGKDPATGEILQDGAWGKMRYRTQGPAFHFVFNGHRLDPNEEYTLIYHPDPWPGLGLVCIAGGSSNNGGNLHLEGSVDLNTDLPAFYDRNYGDGAKIWLVKSGDADCAGRRMTAWEPAKYLFEESLITYDDTDSEANFSGDYCLTLVNGEKFDLAINQTGNSVTFAMREMVLVLVQGSGEVSGNSVILNGDLSGESIVFRLAFAYDMTIAGDYEVSGSSLDRGSLFGQPGSCSCGSGALNPPGDISMLTPYANLDEMAPVRSSYSTSAACPWGFEHRGIDFFPEYSPGPVMDLVPFQAVSSGVVSRVILNLNERNGLWQVNVRIIYNSEYAVEYAFEPFSSSEADGLIQLDNIMVGECQTVSQGDIIGQLYMTDPAAHVHFNFFKNGIKVCPEPYFTPEARESVMTLIRMSNPAMLMCY